MSVHANETVFFYRIDGELRQAVEVEFDFPDSSVDTMEVEISTPAHGSNITKVKDIKQGVSRFICYAPVTFPNFIDGILQPVNAQIELRIGEATYKGSVEIGRHRPWTIYVCQDICTDFTWGMPFDQTVKVSGEMIKAQLEYMQKTDGEKEESRNRWNMNQAVEVEWFLENQDKTAINDLFAREKEGRLEISATYNSNLTAMMSTEQAIRSLYFARELWKNHGIRLDTLEHIEMPTITWGMISIYAKAGIKYFTKAWLDFNSHHLKKCENIPLFYWQGPDDSSVLAYMDKGANLRSSYAHAFFLRGSSGKYSVANIQEQLHGWWIPHFESNEAYPFDAFPLLGAYCDLHEVSKNEIGTLVENIRGYNNEPWEYPKLVNATWRQYFEHVTRYAARHGLEIPVVKGDMGASWEDWPAHYAHIASRIKRGVEDFITAEKMAALESLFAGHTDSSRTDRLSESVKLMNLLAEHPWNGSNDDEKYRSKDRRDYWAGMLGKNIEELFKEFKLSVSGISNNAALQPEIIKVVNLQSWKRSDEVSIAMDGLPGSGSDLQRAAIQVVEEHGSRKAILIADAVPAMGLCSINPYGAVMRCSKVNVSENGIENDFYKIRVNRYNGSIESLWDKKNSCELVNKCERMGLNQFIYQSEHTLHKLGNIKVKPLNCGDLRSSLLIEGETLNSHVSTTLTLYSGLDKIVISNRIRKEPSGEPLNIYFAFPFNIPEREYHYECTGSIIKPGLKEYGGDQLKGSGQEIHCVRNFIDVSNSSMGVTISPLDSYLFQLGGMTYDIMPDAPEASNSTVYSLVMTNHAYAEILRDQGGNTEFEFRYSLTAHKGGFDPVAALKFGWGENNPLIGIPAAEKEGGIFNAYEGSFIECMSENVIITAFKTAEDKDGCILRLWEIGGRDCVAEISLGRLSVKKALTCDIIERENGGSCILEKGILKVFIAAGSIETVKLSS